MYEGVVATSFGVSAGMDKALVVIERHFGADLAHPIAGLWFPPCRYEVRVKR